MELLYNKIWAKTKKSALRWLGRLETTHAIEAMCTIMAKLGRVITHHKKYILIAVFCWLFRSCVTCCCAHTSSCDPLVFLEQRLISLFEFFLELKSNVADLHCILLRDGPKTVWVINILPFSMLLIQCIILELSENYFQPFWLCHCSWCWLHDFFLVVMLPSNIFCCSSGHIYLSPKCIFQFFSRNVSIFPPVCPESDLFLADNQNAPQGDLQEAPWYWVHQGLDLA